MDGRSLMWDGYYARDPYRSTSETGKWMFMPDVGDAFDMMELLYDAVSAGDVPAGKRSTKLLQERLGGKAIVIAYVGAKDPASAAKALARLRARGILGPAEFKDDLATENGMDDIAYLSDDFETGGPMTEGGLLPSGAVLRLDDGTHLDTWLTGHGPDGPRGVAWKLDARDRGGLLPEAGWLDPEVRLARRTHLMRIDFARVVHVIGAEWDGHRPPDAPRGP